MSKGLEAVKRLRMFPIYQETKRFPQQFRDKESVSIDLSIIEKELKALEIIKKTFDMKLVIPFPKGGYEFQIMNKGSYVIHTYENISKEEYDLLKEVLL